jgi:hypothetical protein
MEAEKQIERRSHRSAPDSALHAPPRSTLRRWWLRVDRPKANDPNWDLVTTATFPGRGRGLVLFEAKAYEEELTKEEKGKSADSDPDNHDQIGKAIEEAALGLGGRARGVNIQRDSHYQFSNRVAFAWKLASEGVATVLVYLGFTRDSGIADLGRPLADDADWQRVFHAHIDGVFPANLLEREIRCGKSAMWLIVRSLAGKRRSPPKKKRRSVGDASSL